MTRQQRYQQLHKHHGLCRLCGAHAHGGGLCLKHLTLRRIDRRNRYRKAHGIPLCAPVAVRRPLKYPVKGTP